MLNEIPVIPLYPGYSGQAGDLLGRAFADDPLMSFWLPSPSQRHRHVTALMRFAVRYCLLHGRVETTPQLNGIACWMPPGEVEYHLGSLLSQGWLKIPIQSGIRNYGRIYKNDNHAHGIRLRATPSHHWFLWILGVDPAQQGRGIGWRLVKAGLERVDADHTPCYLDTHNPRNIPIYQRYGFEVVEESTVPGYSLRVWGMLRPAC